MSYRITDDCSSCGACESECPNNAISQGDTTYVIDADRCTECVGFFDAAQCAAVCPVEAPQPDPAKQESKEQLLAKAKKLHPDKTF